MIREDHVDDLELAAFVDGGLEKEARRNVEAHLLTCEECRGLVAGAAGALSGRTRPSPRFVVWVGMAAAAAAVVFMTMPGSGPGSPAPRSRDVEATGPAVAGFTPAAPPDGARVRPDSLEFSWTRAGPGATYQLTLSKGGGAIVWSRETTDTSMALPAGIADSLVPGEIYYWQVDAMLPDLRSASTGPRRFEAAAR